MGRYSLMSNSFSCAGDRSLMLTGSSMSLRLGKNFFIGKVSSACKNSIIFSLSTKGACCRNSSTAEWDLSYRRKNGFGLIWLGKRPMSLIEVTIMFTAGQWSNSSDRNVRNSLLSFSMISSALSRQRSHILSSCDAGVWCFYFIRYSFSFPWKKCMKKSSILS